MVAQRNTTRKSAQPQPLQAQSVQAPGPAVAASNQETLGGLDLAGHSAVEAPEAWLSDPDYQVEGFMMGLMQDPVLHDASAMVFAMPDEIW